VNNVVLLGALSHFLESVPVDAWLQALRERVPARLAELNERAFLLGRDHMGRSEQGEKK
jgi:Pyruvate/2-oxoacid:ferredoxin oxidoreductase gamma subunit